MRDGVDSYRTRACVEGVRDDSIHHMLNGKKPIALKSMVRCQNGSKPLLSSQLLDLTAACHIVRRAEV